MSHLFNRWFAGSNRVHLPVTADGAVRVEGDKVICTSRNPLLNAVVDLTQLQYVYLVTLGKQKNLFLFDHHQHHIPCGIAGFEKFFTELVNRFPIDQDKFFGALPGKGDVKILLWRATPLNNGEWMRASRDATEIRNELAKGFWVLSEPRQWISWDITSDQLAEQPCAYAVTNAYGLQEIRFHYPVEVAAFRLYDFRYYFPRNARTDVPVDHFYTNLRLDGNGDQNYFLAKEALLPLLGVGTTFYEREDQNAYYWEYEGLKISLLYWYDAYATYESGYATLSIHNEKEYPEYLTDRDYERKLFVTERIALETPFTIPSHFRKSIYFKKVPDPLLTT